jgi:CTP synthase (UTP-ammonia lyase)
MRMVRTLAVVGDRDERYETHRGIDRVLSSLPDGLLGRWVATGELDADDVAAADGVWVAPGSPYRDRDAVLTVIGDAREVGQPILGSCGGFQHMVLEFARSVDGVADGEHGEEHPGAADLVLTRLACSLVGQVRPVTTVPGTRAAAICGSEPFDGFHYCTFGLDSQFEQRLVDAGLVISGHAPDAGVEIVELPDHPFYFGTMFQPQMSPAPDGREHPLLEAFLAATG